ncbi:MAG: protein kinase [Polyangiaceae bacterium]
MNDTNSADERSVESSPGLVTGAVLEGRYRLDKKVGEGGHGVVYAGHHLMLDQALAIKVVRLNDDGGALVGERAARFLDEARTMSKLRHSNIVRVLDVGVHMGKDAALTQAWLVMEWCGSRTLRDDLKARGGAPRSVAETWALLGPLIDAVAYAHKRGVVHRDIKPSNIMLVVEPGHPESARLIDFGIAKSGSVPQVNSGWTRSTGPGVFTPGYAAPEQVLGVRTGPWTDVHALALVLAEVLTGRSAYGEDAEVATIVAEARPTPGALGVDVGPWEAVLRRALAVRTTDRFADAGEFYAALASTAPEDAHGNASATAVGAHLKASSAPDKPGVTSDAAPNGLTIRTHRTGGPEATPVVSTPVAPLERDDVNATPARGESSPPETSEEALTPESSEESGETLSESPLAGTNPSRRWLVAAVGAVALSGVGLYFLIPSAEEPANPAPSVSSSARPTASATLPAESRNTSSAGVDTGPLRSLATELPSAKPESSSARTVSVPRPTATPSASASITAQPVASAPPATTAASAEKPKIPTLH